MNKENFMLLSDYEQVKRMTLATGIFTMFRAGKFNIMKVYLLDNYKILKNIFDSGMLNDAKKIENIMLNLKDEN